MISTSTENIGIYKGLLESFPVQCKICHEKFSIDLLEEEYQHFEAFPVGRLDKDTEGLLLITNDGQLAHNLLSPKKGVDKEYYVEVQGKVGEKEIKKFAKRVEE